MRKRGKRSGRRLRKTVRENNSLYPLLLALLSMFNPSERSCPEMKRV